MDFPSGDQSNPDLPPGVDVSGVGHPPSDETNTICPCQESANHLPSGDRLGACNVSTLARSSSVSLAGSIAEVLSEYAATLNAISAITMTALLFILPSCGDGRANWQFALFSRKTASKESGQMPVCPSFAPRSSFFRAVAMRRMELIGKSLGTHRFQRAVSARGLLIEISRPQTRGEVYPGLVPKR